MSRVWNLTGAIQTWFSFVVSYFLNYYFFIDFWQDYILIYVTWEFIAQLYNLLSVLFLLIRRTMSTLVGWSISLSKEAQVSNILILGHMYRLKNKNKSMTSGTKNIIVLACVRLTQHVYWIVNKKSSCYFFRCSCWCIILD